MQIKLLFVFIFCAAFGVHSSGIENKIKDYFKSDVFKAFQKHWRAHRSTFEIAIILALKESYGHIGMNIFVRRSADGLKLCPGLYGSDNVVDRLLIEPTLTELPNLINPEVMFALSSNVLRVQAGLSRMIMEAEYMLFRNQSDVVYSVEEQTARKSPFSYVQVQPSGKLAIVAEDCMLEGYVITKLSGVSVNLGHDTFRVKHCKFTVEITSNPPGQPPIIAPYFTDEQSKQLEFLLSRPVRAEMMPKLQAAVFTYINTSLIFGDYLPKFRKYQSNMFKETLKYVKDIVTAINIKTVEAKKVTVDVESVTLTWKTKCPEDFCSGTIVVENVTLHGLDTLYSSHTGSPYKIQSAKIAESLRFHSLMVRGSISFENYTVIANHVFVAEIHDVAVDFEIDVEKPEARFEVVSWRMLAYSVIGLEKEQQEGQKVLNAFVHGYLLNILPVLLNNHLTDIYQHLNDAKPMLALDTKKCACAT